MNNYFNFIYVNLAFLAMIAVMFYFRSALDIKKNWALYRCNPPYWVFSENISEDFTYCVQNTQMNMMGYLLQPVNYMISSLTTVGGNLNQSINGVRTMFGNVRDFIGSIIENVFGVFLNIIVEFQKMIISIKDTIGKMVGIVVTLMYVLDGSIKTMNSTWKGPPGQMVRAIGSCFHPETKVRLKNGDIHEMQSLPLGAELEEGGKVFAVLKIHNFRKEKFYKVSNGVNGEDIFVTGEHFIFDKLTQTWRKVQEIKDAELTDNINGYFSCLITTSGTMRIGDNIFWDWEDDELNNKISQIRENK